MTKLDLSIAIGNYDRTRALLDGAVQIDGVEPVYMALSPEEIFFRAFRHAEFDICELSLSSHTIRVADGTSVYVGVPAFVSRAFRHNSIYVRRDRISRPADLRGRRIGLPEYQLTANVWARAILEDDFGVTPADVIWVRGGIEEPGRPEKIALALPPEVRLEDAPHDATISGMLDRGEIDGFMAPRPPSCAATNPQVGWLFADPASAAKDYFARTGVFPIMHIVGVRRTLADRHPWLPAAVLKAFEAAKVAALAALADTSASKVTLPFIEQHLMAARDLMGADFWPYGVASSRRTLDAFVRHHHAQGLSRRRVGVKELFHPATLETAKV
jgi:4,5-dihydroxyphthalate decarboxylase